MVPPLPAGAETPNPAALSQACAWDEQGVSSDSRRWAGRKGPLQRLPSARLPWRAFRRAGGPKRRGGWAKAGVLPSVAEPPWLPEKLLKLKLESEIQMKSEPLIRP